MMVRQGDQRISVRCLDRNDPEAVIENSMLYEFRERLGDFELSRADLDCDFPVSCGTHEYPVCRVGDLALCGGAEVVRIEVAPDQRMRIDEQIHCMYSLKSLRCSSSSS